MSAEDSPGLYFMVVVIIVILLGILWFVAHPPAPSATTKAAAPPPATLPCDALTLTYLQTPNPTYLVNTTVAAKFSPEVTQRCTTESVPVDVKATLHGPTAGTWGNMLYSTGVADVNFTDLYVGTYVLYLNATAPTYHGGVYGNGANYTVNETFVFRVLPPPCLYQAWFSIDNNGDATSFMVHFQQKCALMMTVSYEGSGGWRYEPSLNRSWNGTGGVNTTLPLQTNWYAVSVDVVDQYGWFNAGNFERCPSPYGSQPGCEPFVIVNGVGESPNYNSGCTLCGQPLWVDITVPIAMGAVPMLLIIGVILFDDKVLAPRRARARREHEQRREEEEGEYAD